MKTENTPATRLQNPVRLVRQVVAAPAAGVVVKTEIKAGPKYSQVVPL